MYFDSSCWITQYIMPVRDSLKRSTKSTTASTILLNTVIRQQLSPSREADNLNMERLRDQNSQSSESAGELKEIRRLIEGLKETIETQSTN